jgi:hypothetical protein
MATPTVPCAPCGRLTCWNGTDTLLDIHETSGEADGASSEVATGSKPAPVL